MTHTCGSELVYEAAEVGAHGADEGGAADVRVEIQHLKRKILR
jgi:hypothetical protein